MPKFLISILILFFCQSSLALDMPLSSGIDSKSNCLKGESIILSCTHNKKLYSVCASTSLNETNGYLYYAVTKNGHLEMAFPAKKQHPKGIFTYSMQRRGGELSFTNDGFTYRFYSDVGGNGAIEGDSIHIDKGGKKISSFNCERTIYDTGMAMTPVENLMTSAGLAK